LPNATEPNSDFEIAVIDVLRSRGYEVTPQLGVAGYRIVIAVMRSCFVTALAACFLDAMPEDQLMDFCHDAT